MNGEVKLLRKFKEKFFFFGGGGQGVGLGGGGVSGWMGKEN